MKDVFGVYSNFAIRSLMLYKKYFCFDFFKTRKIYTYMCVKVIVYISKDGGFVFIL